MATLVLRTVKGVPLTNAEVDGNFSNINTDVGVVYNTANTINSNIGVLSNLITTAKSNIVAAINEIAAESTSNVTITGGSFANIAGSNVNITSGNISSANVTITGGTISGTTGWSGNTISIAKGGTNQTAFTAPASSVQGLVFFNGTSLANDSNVYHAGYNDTTGFLVANTISVANSIITPTLIAASNIISSGNVAGNYILGDGSKLTGINASGGASITNDTTTNSTYYPVFTTTTTGTMTTANVSTTSLYYTPSTGTLNAVIFNSLSDELMKENIINITNGLAVLKQVNAVEYDWKDSGKHSSGVIAQQIESIIPYLVETNDQGVKSVNYSGLIAFLIGAVKELSEKVEQLENR